MSKKGFYDANVIINEKLIGTCNYKDTIYYKANKVNVINLAFSFPGSLAFKYEPKNKKSNTFSFTVQAEIDGNNISIENGKLLFKNNELQPITTVRPLTCEKNYIKVKQ